MFPSHDQPTSIHQHTTRLALCLLALCVWQPCALSDEPSLDVDVPSSGSSIESDPLFQSILGRNAPPVRLAPTVIDDSLFPDSVSSIQQTEEPKKDSQLIEIAIRVAPSVVSLRVWDEFGMELSSGSGFFVSASGIIATDAGLLNPNFAEDISYITVRTGDGQNFRVEGVLYHDMVTGVAIIKTDAKGMPAIKLHKPVKIKSGAPVTIVAIHETKGLSLAEATASADTTLSGAGWINIEGADSPGAPGSPVFDSRGDIVGVVALKVPLDRWVNFAKPIQPFIDVLHNTNTTGVRPLSSLARSKGRPLEENQSFANIITMMKEKRYKTATKNLIVLTRDYPRASEPWALLGMTSAELGATQEAVRCQQKAAALDPTIGDHWINLAATQLVHSKRIGQQADDDAVLESLQNASRERPGDPKVWSLLADHLIKREDFEAADIALQQLVKVRFGDGDAFYRLGYVRSKIGDYTAAETALKRSADIKNSPECWFLLGLVRSKAEDHKGAAEAFKKTVRSNPNHPHAWLNLATAYRNAGQENNARTAYREHRTRSEQRAKQQS